MRHVPDELADIVAEHVVLKNGAPRIEITEKEIVYYADKRILHDKIVSIDRRLEYILERYGNNDEGFCRKIRRNFNNCRAIEELLFSKLGTSPEDVDKMLKENSSTIFDSQSREM